MRSETFKTEQKRKLKRSLMTTALLACAVILVSCGSVDDSKEVEKFEASVTSAPTYAVTTTRAAEESATETTTVSSQTSAETSAGTSALTTKNTEKTKTSATSGSKTTTTGKASSTSKTSSTGKTSSASKNSSVGSSNGKQPDSSVGSTASSSSQGSSQQPTQQTTSTTAPRTEPTTTSGSTTTTTTAAAQRPTVLPRVDSREFLLQQLKEDRLRNAAKQILEGVQAGQASILVDSGILRTDEIDDLMPFISMLEAESYVTPLSYNYTYSGNYVTGLKIENYSKPHDKYLSEKDTVEKTVKNIVADANAKCADQYEKVLYFHDYIVKNCVYDLNTGVDGASAYGCLIGGRAVCEGYAKAMMLLCNEAGIQCTLVIGDVERGNTTIGHMWDLINIDGVWTHVDVTWDDVVVNDENLCCYSYLGLTDSEIVADHTIKPLDILNTFKAQSSAMNYHIKKGLYIKSEKEIASVMEKAVENAVVSGTQTVTLKCADRQTYTKLCDIIRNEIYDYTARAAEKTGGKAVRNVNFFGQDGLNTAVIILRY